ncbi:MAG TPA: hypothetical protein VL327_07910, partial [Pyrinomonadaceae bacterium]|nr:hypothetical protein [Pyrinomonadaceae bacterium]
QPNALMVSERHTFGYILSIVSLPRANVPFYLIRSSVVYLIQCTTYDTIPKGDHLLDGLVL